MMRTPPAETDRYAYDLDAVQLGGVGLGGPTLREILFFACTHGAEEGIHDDELHSQEWADICEQYLPRVQGSEPLELTVADARQLYEACLSTWQYADNNNYGDESEEDPEARTFGEHGRFMLQALARPWGALGLSDNGEHGFKRVD